MSGTSPVGSFNPSRGLIIVTGRVHGPRGHRLVRFALDTGATQTTIRTATLVLIGYDPGNVSERLTLTTGSGIEYVSPLIVDRLEALDQQRQFFPVLAHTLPPSAGVDGLLGLDFFHNQALTLDFRTGTIHLR